MLAVKVPPVGHLGERVLSRANHHRRTVPGGASTSAKRIRLPVHCLEERARARMAERYVPAPRATAARRVERRGRRAKEGKEGR